MSLTKRYEDALERERVALSFRTPEAKKVVRKVFEEAEGNTISDRIISVLRKGLEAEVRGDRVYRQDEDNFDFEKYLEDEPISKNSSREEKDEWFDEKADEIEERLDSVEEKLEKREDKKMKESEHIKDLKRQLGNMYAQNTEIQDEELKQLVEDGEISRSEALKRELQDMHEDGSPEPEDDQSQAETNKEALKNMGGNN